MCIRDKCNQALCLLMQGVLRVRVCSRLCRRGTCDVEYTGEEDSVFFWSKDIAIGDELGYIFRDMLFNCGMSFRAFTVHMSSVYSMRAGSARSFMSCTSWVKVFFGWLGSFNVDFRQEVDPWCGHNPRMLACDGTHVGPAVCKLDIRPIDAPELDRHVAPNHRRYTRVFLPYQTGLSDSDVRYARQHLSQLCQHILVSSVEARPVDQQKTEALLRVAPPESHTVLRRFCSRDYSPRLCVRLAAFLRILSSDTPLIAVLPKAYHGVVSTALQEAVETGSTARAIAPLRNVCPEVSAVLQVCEGAEVTEIANFFSFLVSATAALHHSDPCTSQSATMSGTYDPSKGVAYYFSESGEQVRQLPVFDVHSATREFDDAPTTDRPCSKLYPTVSIGGYSNVFLWFCPTHGHCYGFHIIKGAEGRKDPFASLLKYKPDPPEHVFYDFACSLSEYSLNRDPGYFGRVRFWHDLFHGFSHSCSDAFRSSRLLSLSPNTEICEQFNAFLKPFKYTATHLSQNRFCFLLQHAILRWNERRTESYRKRFHIAVLGSQ